MERGKPNQTKANQTKLDFRSTRFWCVQKRERKLRSSNLFRPQQGGWWYVLVWRGARRVGSCRWWQTTHVFVRDTHHKHDLHLQQEWKPATAADNQRHFLVFFAHNSWFQRLLWTDPAQRLMRFNGDRHTFGNMTFGVNVAVYFCHGGMEVVSTCSIDLHQGRWMECGGGGRSVYPVVWGYLHSVVRVFLGLEKLGDWSPMMGRVFLPSWDSPWETIFVCKNSQAVRKIASRCVIHFSHFLVCSISASECACREYQVWHTCTPSLI